MTFLAKTPLIQHRIGKIRWGWFRDTSTTKFILVVVGINHIDEARRVGKLLMDDTFDIASGGHFSGLHVSIGGKRNSFLGSILFLDTPSQSILAHEVCHAVSKICDHHGIFEDEARCTYVSGWMQTISEIFKFKNP
jgi:hypothetical protein